MHIQLKFVFLTEVFVKLSHYNTIPYNTTPYQVQWLLLN